MKNSQRLTLTIRFGMLHSLTKQGKLRIIPVLNKSIASVVFPLVMHGSSTVRVDLYKNAAWSGIRIVQATAVKSSKCFLKTLSHWSASAAAFPAGLILWTHSGIFCQMAWMLLRKFRRRDSISADSGIKTEICRGTPPVFNTRMIKRRPWAPARSRVFYFLIS